MKNPKLTYEELEFQNTQLKKQIEETNLEKENLEKLLIEWENKFSSIFNSTGTSNSIFDTKCILRLQNSLSIKTLGRGDTGGIGLSVFELFGEEFGKVIFERMNRVIKTGLAETYETEFDLPGGKQWFSSAYQPIFDENKKTVFVQVISRDITKRKTLEFENLFHSTVLDQIHNAVITIDFTNTILYWNKFAEILYQWTSEEAVGKNIVELLSPEESEDITKNNFENLYRDGHWEGNYEVKRKDNSKILVHITNTYLKDSNDKEIGFIGISFDITEYKKAEQALKESEKKFKALVWDMRVGVLLQGPNAEILMSNPAALELLGLTEDQILGKTSYDPDWKVIHEDGSDFPGHTHPVPTAIATCQPVQGVIMGVYHPLCEEYVWLLVDAIPEIVMNGTVQQVICTFIDISDRKRAEQALIESDKKLKELNATKDKFFSLIAHDLRGPINNLTPFLELLSSTTYSPEQFNEYLNLLKGATKSTSSLLENLLAWARSQTGDIPYNPSKDSINELIDSNIRLFQTFAETKKVRLTSKINKIFYAYFDRNLIDTVLRNLINNALKYTKENDSIVISVKKANDKIIVKVFDTGIGMNKSRVNSLFRIDVHQSAIGTKGEKGTGLGLILCKEFIDKHGEKIIVKSKLGKGSIFLFTLPVVEQ
ncbi:MAG: PAS domain-containing sensor histidine kinase [Leptospiraceae bacterium]|nr:PAS domain-containing sensor histidine kinase [Leptospiraceae bacterium]